MATVVTLLSSPASGWVARWLAAEANQNDEVNVSPYREDAFVGFYWPKGAGCWHVTGIKTLPIVTNTGKAGLKRDLRSFKKKSRIVITWMTHISAKA